jgi:hypothetical protein
MSGKLEVHGAVVPGFERVREEFAAALAEEAHNEPGSQPAAYLGGRLEEVRAKGQASVGGGTVSSVSLHFGVTAVGPAHRPRIRTPSR